MSKPEPKKASEREIEYRRATPRDSQGISDLLLEAFGEFKSEYTPGAFDYTTPGVEIVCGRFEEGPIWVAIDGDVMAGTVSGLPEPDRFYIRSMAVKPGMQGRGIGKKLLDLLEGHARELGFEKLYLYTTFVLPAAHRLYEKNGFYILRETPPDEWFEMPGLEMEKILV